MSDEEICLHLKHLLYIDSTALYNWGSTHGKNDRNFLYEQCLNHTKKDNFSEIYNTIEKTYNHRKSIFVKKNDWLNEGWEPEEYAKKYSYEGLKYVKKQIII